MCLYTDQKVPEDLTGVVAYKRYDITWGSLVTVIRGVEVTSLVQVAEGPETAPEPVKTNWIRYGQILHIGPGYIHAHLTLESGIAVAVYSRNHIVIIKGRLIGPGYKSRFTDEVCAKGFRMEEIAYELAGGLRCA